MGVIGGDFREKREVHESERMNQNRLAATGRGAPRKAQGV